MVQATPRETEDLIIAAYQDGVTVRLIGDQYGVSRETVHNVLRRRGVQRRRRPGGKRKEFTAAELDRLRELREANWSIEELSDEFHTGYERIRRAIDQLGLNPKIRRRDSRDRIITSQGYVYVFVSVDDPMRVMAGPDGNALEHRIVMARALGRPLLAHPAETVHHINGRRDDNRIENLQLRTGNHGSGVVMICRNCGSNDVVPTGLAS